jgi:hypothetical protein
MAWWTASGTCASFGDGWECESGQERIVTDDGERQDGGHDGRDAREGFDDESYVELSLPEGTVIRPAECGFVLPTGQYLRVYSHGVDG